MDEEQNTSTKNAEDTTVDNDSSLLSLSLTPPHSPSNNTNVKADNTNKSHSDNDISEHLNSDLSAENDRSLREIQIDNLIVNLNYDNFDKDNCQNISQELKPLDFTLNSDDNGNANVKSILDEILNNDQLFDSHNESLPKRANDTSLSLSNDFDIFANVGAVLIDGFQILTPSSRIPFHIDCSQFFTIIRDTYFHLTRDKVFKQAISSTMFEYYCVILLWNRLIYVLSEEGRSGTRLDNFEGSLPADLAVPEEVGRYLDGIGNFVDASGVNSVLRLLHELSGQRVAGMAGHYTQVNAETHTAYETVPAPFVVAYRMCHEYAMHVGNVPPPPPDDDRDVQEDVGHWEELWDLPPQLRPADVALLPNRNLLGWSRALPITREMAALMDQKVVIDHRNHTFVAHPDRTVHNIPLFYDVLCNISVRLKTTKSNAHINTYDSNESFLGSQAQEMYVTRVRGDYGNNESGMALPPLATRLMQVQSNHTSGPHIVSAATVFRYRIERYVDPSSDCLCYTGVKGRAPAGWADTANDAFQHPRWNHSSFNGPLTTGSYASEKYMDHVRNVRRLY